MNNVKKYVFAFSLFPITDYLIHVTILFYIHQALDMIEDIRQRLYERLDEVDWMDKKTKTLATDKVRTHISIIDHDVCKWQYEFVTIKALIYSLL